MVVGTTAAVKGLEADDIQSLGGEVLLANTYHLELRPGSDLIRKAGGLHRFMRWDGPILTDSGGFQVFSLARIRKIAEEGVVFNSHIDGNEMTMSPESAVQSQLNLGADILMAFDECKAPADKESVKESLELTTRWAMRSLHHFQSNKHSPCSLFGIVQGSVFADLRKASARQLVKIGFDGYAIGGLAVGEDASIMYEMIDATVPELPEDQPRYLMGVGTPANIIEAVARGIDMFDCVLPTRNARHGSLFTSQGIVNLKLERYKEDFTSLDPGCLCLTCARYTKAYLRHLLVSGELLGLGLLVRHNVAYYLQLMKDIRGAIEDGKFDTLRRIINDVYA